MNSVQSKSHLSSNVITGGTDSTHHSEDTITNDGLTFENEFEHYFKYLEDDEKIILTDENVDTVLCKCVFMKQKIETIIQRCVEYCSTNTCNKKTVSAPKIFDAFVSACENETLDLIEPLSKYIVEHIDQYVDDEQFLTASSHTLEMLFCHGQSESSKNENYLLKAFMRWVYHNYDERKQCFQVLLKLINLTKHLPKYVASSGYKELKDVHQYPTECVTLNEKFINEKKKELHVFIKYSSNGETKVFGQKNAEWFLMDKIHYYVDIMRNVAIGNKLYQLNYCDDGGPKQYQIFSAGHSAKAMLDWYLNPPPLIMKNFDMCGGHNNIYVCNSDTLNKPKRLKTRTSNNFSHEELSRGIFYYNCGLDAWYPLPAWNHTRVSKACIAIDCTRLYLFGDSCNIFLAQVCDLRAQKWQKLPSPLTEFGVSGCCVHQEKVYIVGRNEESNFQVYNPVAGKWDHLPMLPRMLSPASHGTELSKMISHNDKLWVINHTVADNDMSVDLCYDSKLSKWYSSPSLSLAIRKDDPEIITNSIHPDFSIQDAVVFEAI